MKNHIKLAYDLWAKEYDQDSKWNPAIQMERGRIIPLLNAGKSDTILEIGCGTGRLTIPTAKICKSVVGVDFSECMLEVARRKSESYKNIKYMKIDARKRARCSLGLACDGHTGNSCRFALAQTRVFDRDYVQRY